MVKRRESRRLQIVQLAGGARAGLIGPGEIGRDSIVFETIPNVLINGFACTVYNVGHSESTCKKYRRRLLNLMMAGAVIEKVAANAKNHNIKI